MRMIHSKVDQVQHSFHLDIDAASSLRPPDKNMIPATAAGTERNNVLIVYPATFL